MLLLVDSDEHDFEGPANQHRASFFWA